VTSFSSRFNGHIKNFIILYDEYAEDKFYIEDQKSYPTLEKLVEEGLTTLYLESQAGQYIDLMYELANTKNNGSNNNNTMRTRNLAGQDGTSPRTIRNHNSSSQPSFVKQSSPCPSVTSTLSKKSLVRKKKYLLSTSNAREFHL